MTYRADPGPKLLFRTIALLVVGVFLLMAAQAIVPYFYEKYQLYKLNQCEEKYLVSEDAWTPIFGFDWGARYIVGDSPENRALIACVVDSQTISGSANPPNSDLDPAHSILSIGSGAFSPGLHFEYYEGEKSTKNLSD